MEDRVKLTELAEQVKTLFENYKECKSENTGLKHEIEFLKRETSNLSKALVTLEFMQKDMSEMKQDIKDIKDVPISRYNQTIMIVVTAIVGGLVGYFI